MKRVSSADWLVYLTSEPVNGFTPRAPKALPTSMLILESILCIPVLVSLIILIPPCFLAAMLMRGGISFLKRVATDLRASDQNPSWWH